MKLNKKHLSKLDMPAKKAKPMGEDMGDGELEMELSDLAPEEDASEEEEVGLDQLAAEEPANEQLAAIPDEELLAEIKKRGLMKDLEMEEGEPDEAEKMA
jgi:hypothetical protein